MDVTHPLDRRQFLTATGITVGSVLVAGCSDDGGEGPEEPDDTEDDGVGDEEDDGVGGEDNESDGMGEDNESDGDTGADNESEDDGGAGNESDDSGTDDEDD